LQDLKTLRSQLYSAAQYFELAYMQEDKKQAYVLYPNPLHPSCFPHEIINKQNALAVNFSSHILAYVAPNLLMVWMFICIG
jgi:hypothetical protein